MRRLAVVLHDVAPARWAGCTRVLRVLRECARAAGRELPVTLLVVPCWHGQPDVPPHYLHWLRRQARQGHELALHGWTHLDDGPPPDGWRERLLRRRYTAGEGEFAALPFAAAAERLAAARRWAALHGLQVRGFVPPAWLAGAASRSAIAGAGFGWTCTLRGLQPLPGGRLQPAPALVFSTRSAWRRALSLAWNAMLYAHARHAPLLRLELRPDDADHPALRALWTRLLRHALRTRTPVTLGAAAAAGTPPAPAAA